MTQMEAELLADEIDEWAGTAVTVLVRERNRTWRVEAFHDLVLASREEWDEARYAIESGLELSGLAAPSAASAGAAAAGDRR